MSRACWRCAEPIEDVAARCPSCGARIIPASPSSSTPQSAARKIRIAGSVGLIALGLLVVALARNSLFS